MQTKLADAGIFGVADGRGGVVNGRWRLERRVGRGADAVLWAATDLRDGRSLALKALHAALDGEARQRLRWEFALLAAIEHPHLVRVYDVDCADGDGPLAAGQPFFTSELLDGAAPTRLAGLPAAQRARALCQLVGEVASALEALHRRGLIHHDVKPSNLLVDGAGRTRLCDLGLSSLRGAAGGARGTPAYLAPEALCGAADARVDLYALGASAYELWSGAPPFHGASLAELIRSAQTSRPAPLAGAPLGLQQLIDRLLAVDPAARPSSARTVLEESRRLGARLDGELDGGRDGRAAVLCSPGFVGREAELATLLAELPRARLILIEGVGGSGRSRLVDEARRAAQLADVARGRASLAWRTLGEEAPELAVRGLVTAPSILHVTRVAEPRVEELLGLAARGAAAPSTVVAEVDEGALPALKGDGVVRLRLGALDPPSVARLCASMLGDVERSFSAAVHRASGGIPRLAVEIVRAVAARAEGRPSANDVGNLDGQDLAALVAAALSRLPAAARRLVDALAVVGRAAATTELTALVDLDAAEAWAAAMQARAAGVLELDDDDRLRFPSTAHGDAAYAAVSRRQRAALHRRALAGCPAEAVVDRARHLLAVNAPGAADAALVAGERLANRGELRASVRFLGDAERLGRGPARLRAALLLGLALTEMGDYPGALAVLAPVEAAAHEPHLRLDAAIAAARALQRAGDLPAAEARLRPVLDDAPAGATTPRARDDARGLLGRLLIARGEYARAAEVCASSETPSVAVGEARGLGCLYLSRLDDADAAFAEVERAAAEHPTSLARARSLRGMVAHTRDALADATGLYQSALELARGAEDLHGAAIYAANLGAVLREQGEYERALQPTADAARDLGRLGKRAERAFALFNYGNLLLSIGDVEGADRAAAEAASLAQAADATRELGYARLLGGDLARRRGDRAAAIVAYRSGAATLAGAAASDRLSAALNLAEALADAGDPAGGRAALSEARTLAEAANQVDQWLPSAVRVALQLGDRVEPARLHQLGRLRERAARSLRRDSAFRADLLAARVLIRSGARRRALVCLHRAQQTWKEIRMRTPELRRDAVDEDPDARRLRELLAVADQAPSRAAAAPVPPASMAAAVDAPPLRKLLGINKRINSELRLPVLLDLILDTVLDLTSAERGFVLLTDGAGQWRVEAARNISLAPAGTEVDAAGDPAAMHADAVGSAFSRSIAERAAREGVPIVTLDASGDQRFEAALSVSDLKLRSVLAVPLAVKGRVVGCVYADHRLRAGAFGDADVALVCDLAEQAAIAVENARLLAEGAAARREIAELNRELEKKVASQALEIGELHKEVRSSRAALAVRYNYDNLIGRTPRMLELFRLLDRVTDTALPVVIYGESGTGKELVARAIHHNGPRRGRAFVSESCAAIPETLLEAALFGHVRGAFTGADSERRGLFEVADGGTLFLDEVGEMPASMQVKLLRVLQQGEFRRVGGEKTLKVDVRLLVASNRDLGRLVEDGKFREDLYYRLNVVRVALPPLRERRDDIPLLVEHFLKKFAAENRRPAPRLARAALHKLIGYRWPGNVRELENEVVRAVSLGGEVLTVEDLSPQVASGEPEAAVDSPDDLTLKDRVERLERTLLREALHRAAGNQTQAARLLGMSRFGLQKKLRRYGVEA